MMNEQQPTETIFFEDQPVTVRLPIGPGPSKLLLALHGFTGDQHAMEIFFQRIPPSYRIIAPSAPYPSSLGGRSWVRGDREVLPAIADFDPGLDWLRSLLEHVRTLYSARTETLHALGFSQGAAAAFAFGINFPTEVGSLGSLSGFVPDGADQLLKPHSLAGLPVFIAHGTKDEAVPVEEARRAGMIFERAGATVNYCEDDVGHKLSVNCFRSLADFYRNR